jgi:hypothetical protein
MTSRVDPRAELLLAVNRALIAIYNEHRQDQYGCSMCWPKDGSWPCVTVLEANDLREAYWRELLRAAHLPYWMTAR